MQSSPNQPQGQFPQQQEPSGNNPFGSAEAQAALLNQNLTQAYNAAGGNFYSIAVFSLINSVIGYFDGGLYFPIGLAITQLIDAFSLLFQEEVPGSKTLFFGIGVILDFIVLGIVALFGFFIKRKVKWLIIVGGVLYLLDGLLFLLFQDWIGTAFHAYFIFKIWQSWQLIQKFSPVKIKQQSAIESPL